MATTKLDQNTLNQVTLGKITRVSVWKTDKLEQTEDVVAKEVAVALLYNDIPHMVIMASPSDLQDFALGFSLTEGIIDSAQELLEVNSKQREQGVELKIQISDAAFNRSNFRRRQLVGRTSCGLCGVEALEQAVQKLPQVTPISLKHQAIQSAYQGLQKKQRQKDKTGAVHAAAFCNTDGEILLFREDLGRHNALDKLLGARLKQFPESDGFVLISSRASYEMVAKVAIVGVAGLAAVSAPTSLAIELAQQAGICLIGFVREQRHVIYTFDKRVS